MLHLSALKAATTLRQFAALLKFKPAWLTYLLYVQPEASKYKKFDIPKRSGGTRQICATQGDLKLLQRRLSDYLQDCVSEINKESGRDDAGPNPDRIAHGFKRKRSIATNAREHRNRRYVFNADLTDFFGSINFGRVRGYFISDKNFQLHPAIATLIAQISCFENSLPQGSPCSPVVSNLVGHILDSHLVKLSAQFGVTYTRYADDLTFSTNDRSFPCGIAIPMHGAEHKWEAGAALTQIVKQSGFSLNAAKSRMQYSNSRQEVTGLVVNKKVNVRIEYRRTIRAMVHRLFTTGDFHFETTQIDAAGVEVVVKTLGLPAQLGGMLAFIDQIDLLNRRNLSQAKSSTVTKKEEMYRRFLLFDRFYRSPAPLLVCEGKTDNVYLTHAIRSLAAKYSQLANVTPSGKIELKIRRFRYTGKSTNRILGVNGGTGDLGHLIRLYRAEVERFGAPGMQSPIIVLIDNDDGAPAIYNTINQITHKKPTGIEAHIHVTKNLYVVATPPKTGSTESCIEDCFDSMVTGTLINGKKFTSKNKFDATIEYGKSDFAYKVVQPTADKIDFSGFIPLLDRLVGVIHEHAKKTSAPSAP